MSLDPAVLFLREGYKLLLYSYFANIFVLIILLIMMFQTPDYSVGLTVAQKCCLVILTFFSVDMKKNYYSKLISRAFVWKVKSL